MFRQDLRTRATIGGSSLYSAVGVTVFGSNVSYLYSAVEHLKCGNIGQCDNFTSI